MTKIQITPMWKDVKPQEHYVYVHERSDNGEPFYVGMGQNKRGWTKRSGGAAVWWRRIASKHGVKIRIAQDSLDRDGASLLEMWLIAKFRHEGFALCNITYGGDGCLGVSRSWSRDEQIAARDRFGGREVFCSNGVKYDSSSSAARELSISLGRKVCEGNITNICKGVRKTYLGMSFSYSDFPEKPLFSGESARSHYCRITHSKKVYSSLGESFNSTVEAAMAMVSNGYLRASDVPISHCANGNCLSAYGRSWSYIGFPEHPDRTGREATIFHKSKPVVNNMGEIFESATSAALSMRLRGHPKASQGHLSSAARGDKKTAYGYSWRYTNA